MDQPGGYGKSIRRRRSAIRSISHRLIREKKRKIEDAAANGSTYEGTDFLSRLRELTVTSLLCCKAEHHFSEIRLYKRPGSRRSLLG